MVLVRDRISIKKNGSGEGSGWNGGVGFSVVECEASDAGGRAKESRRERRERTRRGTGWGAS